MYLIKYIMTILFAILISNYIANYLINIKKIQSFIILYHTVYYLLHDDAIIKHYKKTKPENIIINECKK